jgi:hypothetical protein
MSHSLFACDLFSTHSLGLVYISNANRLVVVLKLCKFQIRPIHPPLGDFQGAPCFLASYLERTFGLSALGSEQSWDV